MKTLIIIIVTLWLSVVVAMASGCFFSHSSTSGMYKICVYDCLEGDRAITIQAYEICPLWL